MNTTTCSAPGRENCPCVRPIHGVAYENQSRCMYCKRDLEIVAKAGDHEFTRDELKTAFERVADKQNWKNPIRALITEHLTDRDFIAIREAVSFFAGCVPMFRLTPDGVKVTAPGYYVAVGA